jgi:catechol 2,3-dioxygenase-like lactoylglutathione lyase family enzyme
MEPRVHVITLAVSDLERALAFYRELGFESPGVVGTEFSGDDDNPGGAAAMFELRNGLILSLYARADLAKDAGIPLGSPESGEFSIGQLVAGRADATCCSRRPRPPARRSRSGRMSARGGSIPATSAISTGTCGRSSGTLDSAARPPRQAEVASRAGGALCSCRRLDTTRRAAPGHPEDEERDAR